EIMLRYNVLYNMFVWLFYMTWNIREDRLIDHFPCPYRST
uniref:Uncharacterized protein n=1 Tax=Aegilops tauschii subsp. strangulata TaxID=200361 RepID=A0A453BTM9_AEGTS